MVDPAVPDGAAAQKLPNPCVGYSAAAGGSSAASRRADRCWAAASPAACSAPSRSVRPVDPCSSEPPLNTAMAWPAAASSSA